MLKIAGIDEAGRGSVIGPLVVAGVSFSEDSLKKLPRLGVKDSKVLSSRKRKFLEAEILDLAIGISYFTLDPWAIDNVVNRSKKYRKLNYLEAMAMAKTIRDLHPDEVFVDAADVLPLRFKDYILNVIDWEPVITCENKADSKYPVVAAASILAKVKRDELIGKLKEVYGDLGSGYPSDYKTRKFLESWFQTHETSPSFARSSWKTIKKIMAHRQCDDLATTNA